MNCYIVRSRLEKMAAGEIGGVLRSQIQEHFRSCPGCLKEYQAMKQALEMMEQEPQEAEKRSFSPVWRQRIRQRAVREELRRRSFFSVFKANTLVPALGVLVVFAVLGVFSVLIRFTPKVVIKPSIEGYSPLMSSTIGIPLIAKLTGGKTPQKVVYHWTAEYGRFLSWGGEVTELGTDIRIQENEVYWSIDAKEISEFTSFDIHLQVEAFKTGKTITRTSLSLEKDEEGFFVVRK
ncbi:MAG: hypothetical protein GXY86_16880 [Firmicutes bacterium]|nr:hypothetical protein [Bacillota bacterium]